MSIGDHLSSKMILWGAPDCINTGKCLMTAGEKGCDIEARIFDPSASEIQSPSPLGIGPILRDVDHYVVGHIPIMSYLDDKGFGPSLVIRNGVVRAIQHQWANYTVEAVQPNMDDEAIVDKALGMLNERLTVSDARMRGDFICGQFSLADIHWAATINMMYIQGKGNLVDKHNGVTGWWGRVKDHMSTSKEKLKPFECMPTSDDVSAGKLRDVLINT